MSRRRAGAGTSPAQTTTLTPEQRLAQIDAMPFGKITREIRAERRQLKELVGGDGGKLLEAFVDADGVLAIAIQPADPAKTRTAQDGGKRGYLAKDIRIRVEHGGKTYVSNQLFLLEQD